MGSFYGIQLVDNFHFSLLARSYVLCSPNQPACFAICSDRYTLRPGPANLPIGARETKLLIKRAGMCKVLELGEDANPVLGMDQVLVCDRIIMQALNRVSGERGIGGVGGG